MTKPLLRETQEIELKRLQAHLINTSKKSSKSVSLSKKDLDRIVRLLNSIFVEKPIVVGEYLTPNEAAKLAGISRPVVIEMLRAGGLIGHQVGKHWRIKKESLLEYINTRDKATKAALAFDDAGFGIDE